MTNDDPNERIDSPTYFHSSSALQEHNSQAKFRCPLCKLEFVESKKLFLHIKQRHGDRPFKCSQCDRAYAYKRTLDQHINNYHKNPGSFICGICGMKFNRKDYLDKHVYRHSDSKDFPCSYCDKSFKTKSLLSSHIHGYHQNDKQYVCDDCGFRSSWNSVYLEHIKLHSRTSQRGEKLEPNFLNNSGD